MTVVVHTDRRPNRDARSIYRARNLAGVRRARTILRLARQLADEGVAVGYDQADVVDLRGSSYPHRRARGRGAGDG